MTGLTVVGIPARNESSTVSGVARVAAEGLSRLDGDGCVVLAENGSTDDTVQAFRSTALDVESRVLSAPGPDTGKGTNVFALIDAALDLGVDRLVLLDADLRSADASWVERLARAVDGPGAAMATPVYLRDRFEAGTTNHLVRPLLAGLLDGRLQQPIGGEFAFNHSFMRESLRWRRPSSSHLYGVDIWLTANAVSRGHRITEVPLGRKIHSTPFRNVLRLPQQVLDAMLEVAADRAACDPPRGSSVISTTARASVLEGNGVPQPPDDVDAVLRRVRRYLDDHRREVVRMFPAVRGPDRADACPRISTDQWPTVLAEGIEAMTSGSYVRARDHLVALYVCRLVSFWDETTGLPAAKVETLLLDQIEETAKACTGIRPALESLPTTTAIPFDAGLWAGRT